MKISIGLSTVTSTTFVILLLSISILAGCNLSNPISPNSSLVSQTSEPLITSTTVFSNPMTEQGNLQTPSTNLSAQIIGVWVSNDGLSLIISDFGRYGNVIYTRDTAIYPYEVKSESTIIIGNAVGDVLNIDKNSLDLVITDADYNVHQERKYTRAGYPIPDFKQIIIGHWKWGDCPGFCGEHEYLPNGQIISYVQFISDDKPQINYIEGTYTIESDNTTCYSPSSRFSENDPGGCLTYTKMNNREALSVVPFIDKFEYVTEYRVEEITDISTQIIGKWILVEGNETGTLEFFFDGAVIDHDRGTIMTYEILSPDIIKISTYPSVFWVMKLDGNSLNLSYEGKAIEYNRK